MLNRVMIGLAAAGAATVVGVGVWLGTSGTVDLVDEDSAPATVTESDAGSVAYFACPNQVALGVLRAGDRVYLTGQDADGEWVEVRSPLDDGSSAWVRADVVDPDREADLPEVDCNPAVLALAATMATVPEEEVPEETPIVDDEVPTTTTTAGPGPTPTTPPGPGPGPGPTQPPVTQPQVTPTTQAPAPAPVIGTISRSETSITEDWACGPPHTSNVSAQIQNATSAVMSWNVGPHPRAITMARQGSTFYAELGPFGEHAVTPPPSTVTITVTITATGPGGSSTRSTTVQLNDCFFG